MKLQIKSERVGDGFVVGTVRGWPAETWSGESSNPESYNFKISSPKAGQVKVSLVVNTSAGHPRALKANQRRDLKTTISKHYEKMFPGQIPRK